MSKKKPKIREKSITELTREFDQMMLAANRVERRPARRRSATKKHSSRSAGVLPRFARQATEHAAANGFSDVTYDKHGVAHMREHSVARWNKYLTTLPTPMIDFQHG